MAGFPAELDEYLDRCAHERNFDFEAISAELKASAAGFLRHPYADEPEDMVLARAALIFAPESLRARWEARHGTWEVVSMQEEGWELVAADDGRCPLSDDEDWLHDDLIEVEPLSAHCVPVGHELMQEESPAASPEPYEPRACGGQGSQRELSEDELAEVFGLPPEILPENLQLLPPRGSGAAAAAALAAAAASASERKPISVVEKRVACLKPAAVPAVLPNKGCRAQWKQLPTIKGARVPAARSSQRASGGAAEDSDSESENEWFLNRRSHLGLEPHSRVPCATAPRTAWA